MVSSQVFLLTYYLMKKERRREKSQFYRIFSNLGWIYLAQSALKLRRLALR